MNKDEAINNAKSMLLTFLKGEDVINGHHTIHALLTYISMLEDQAQKLCIWDIKHPISFAQLPRKDAEAAEIELDDIIIDFRGLIQGRIIGGLEK